MKQKSLTRGVAVLAALAIVNTLPVHSLGQGREVIAHYTFDTEVAPGRDGWSVGGSEEIVRWLPKGTDGLRSNALAVVDESTGRYGAWVSQPIAIPGEARLAGRLEAVWEEAHSIDSNQMRVTFYFNDATGERLDALTWHASGTSAGWADRRFHRRSETLTLPHEAVSVQFSLVSGGPPATTGTYLLNSMTLRAPEGVSSIVREGDVHLVPIVTWDLDEQNFRSPYIPDEWERVGPPPHVAVWASDIRSSGQRSLALIDQDTRNGGQWVSRRFPLAPAPEELEFGFDIRCQDLVGTWAVALHFIRQPVDALNGQLIERVDGMLSQTSNGLRIRWVRVTEHGDQAFGTTLLDFADRNPRGFWEVSRRFPLPEDARSMRVSFRSGPDTEGTGLAWFDNPTINAVLPAEGGN